MEHLHDHQVDAPMANKITVGLHMLALEFRWMRLPDRPRFDYSYCENACMTIMSAT